MDSSLSLFPVGIWSFQKEVWIESSLIWDTYFDKIWLNVDSITRNPHIGFYEKYETEKNGHQPLYLFSQPVRELVHIYLKIKKAQAMHRLYVQEKGFILTQDLKVGDPLLGLKKVSPNLSRLIRLLSFYKIFVDMSI